MFFDSLKELPIQTTVQCLDALSTLAPPPRLLSHPSFYLDKLHALSLDNITSQLEQLPSSRGVVPPSVLSDSLESISSVLNSLSCSDVHNQLNSIQSELSTTQQQLLQAKQLQQQLTFNHSSYVSMTLSLSNLSSFLAGLDELTSTIQRAEKLSKDGLVLARTVVADLNQNLVSLLSKLSGFVSDCIDTSADVNTTVQGLVPALNHLAARPLLLERALLRLLNQRIASVNAELSNSIGSSLSETLTKIHQVCAVEVDYLFKLMDSNSAVEYLVNYITSNSLITDHLKIVTVTFGKSKSRRGELEQEFFDFESFESEINFIELISHLQFKLEQLLASHLSEIASNSVSASFNIIKSFINKLDNSLIKLLNDEFFVLKYVKILQSLSRLYNLDHFDMKFDCLDLIQSFSQNLIDQGCSIAQENFNFCFNFLSNYSTILKELAISVNCPLIEKIHSCFISNFDLIISNATNHSCYYAFNVLEIAQFIQHLDSKEFSPCEELFVTKMTKAFHFIKTNFSIPLPEQLENGQFSSFNVVRSRAYEKFCKIWNNLIQKGHNLLKNYEITSVEKHLQL
ncbi:hypothetical protein P9112_002921 [Eukaryota sp. TZLM1-RC]